MTREKIIELCDRNLSNLSGLIILNVMLKTQGQLNDQEITNYQRMLRELFDHDQILQQHNYCLPEI